MSFVENVWNEFKLFNESIVVLNGRRDEWLNDYSIRDLCIWLQLQCKRSVVCRMSDDISVCFEAHIDSDFSKL